MHRVAVYGTLKRGHGNNRILEASVLIGIGRTSPEYRMYVSGIPYVSRDPEGYPIHVEVYDVDDATLSRLDRLEGHPEFYRRELCAVHTPEGDSKAWMYLVTGYSNLPEELSGCY